MSVRAMLAALAALGHGSKRELEELP